MPVELKIPAVGESITEVQIGDWLKTEGDAVQADEPVAVIDSEKTTFELPAPQSGKLAKILHHTGDTVRVGTVIGHVEPGGETEKKGQAESESARPGAEPSAAATSKVTPPSHKEKENADAESAKSPERDSAKPALAVSSPNAVPEKPSPEDPTNPSMGQPPNLPAVEESTTKPGADREEKAVPMTMLRRTVARRLVEARQTMAMLTTFNEVDMSAVLAVRKEHQEGFQKRYQVKLGLMSFFVRAVVDALKQFPQLNAEIRDDDIVYRNYFDLAVAVATDRGLVAPVLRNVERLSFSEIEKTIGDFSHRAKDGKLKPEELEGGTFTITNGGVFGSLLSTPIINPPQAGVLGMHAIQERPIAIQGEIAVRPMMYLALTYDHRLVDGREAVLFLRRIKEAIENPVRMLIEV